MVERKTIVIISNSPTHPSGVAGQCRQICKALWRAGYNIKVIAYSLLNPSPPPEKVRFECAEEVTIYHTQLNPEGKFDNLNLLVKLVIDDNPACLILFDDPHRFISFLDHAPFIRSKMPIYFCHLWDTWLAPHPAGAPHYNLPILENMDGIGCISRQSEWFVSKVFEKVEFSPVPPITYVGHGSDHNVFKPMEESELTETRKFVFGGADVEFAVLCVNQNQHRKKIPDLIEAWRIFFEGLPKEQSAKCALVLKTQINHPMGTDLHAVIRSLAPVHNVCILSNFCSDVELAKIYNVADVVVNVANAEGFGLTLNEGMLCGKCVIANAVGGMVDQLGFEGAWTPEIYTEPGPWAMPLKGERTIIGSSVTPYLYDYNLSIDRIAGALHYWHRVPPDERKRRGLQGREWCLSKGLYGRAFGEAVARDVNMLVEKFTPRPNWHIYKL
jgi:glycosyltransferase involved in cell wall biosynthesis